MHITTEAAREIATDTRKVIYPHGRVRQIAADLVTEREKVAALEAEAAAHAAATDEYMALLRKVAGKRDLHNIGDGIRKLTVELAELNQAWIETNNDYDILARHAYSAAQKAFPNKRPHSPLEAIDDLVAALTEARKDGERLNYLERGGWSLI